EGAGILGRGYDGVIGTGQISGVAGICPKEGSGIQGFSRSGPGGSFYSEKGFSLVAGGEDDVRGVKSSDWAFLCNNKSLFKNSLYFSEKGIDSIARYFPVERADVLSPGDIMIASRDRAGFLQKSRNPGSSGVIGVVVGAASLILNIPEDYPPPSDGGTRHSEFALVSFVGVVNLKVSAEAGEIMPGDLLVTSSRPGTAQKLEKEKFLPGVVFAKSLGSIRSGEGMIQAVILSA
ncbi:MAG: hypothetical protein OEZ34_09820, partial [Spirochaetia bacterium]|nr:hypothetical protein [Spirochaetia bacterium]